VRGTQNAAIALAAVEAFLGTGTMRQIDLATVRAGFAEATSPGRLERVRSAPAILLDVAHNPHAMTATVAALALKQARFGLRGCWSASECMDDLCVGFVVVSGRLVLVAGTGSGPF
jgi:folylpolyglutamate synthase/dihydropteroate synthase